jgi:hypothetical protein
LGTLFYGQPSVYRNVRWWDHVRVSALTSEFQTISQLSVNLGIQELPNSVTSQVPPESPFRRRQDRRCDIGDGYRTPSVSVCSSGGLLINITISNINMASYATGWKVAGSRPDDVNFFLNVSLPAALDPGVYSASNRNEHQKQKGNVSGK